MSTRFFVVPAPGYYGDRTRVLSSHRTRAAAHRAAAAGPGYVARVGGLPKGAEFLRVNEDMFPIAQAQDAPAAQDAQCPTHGCARWQCVNAHG